MPQVAAYTYRLVCDAADLRICVRTNPGALSTRAPGNAPLLSDKEENLNRKKSGTHMGVRLQGRTPSGASAHQPFPRRLSRFIIQDGGYAALCVRDLAVHSTADGIKRKSVIYTHATLSPHPTRRGRPPVSSWYSHIAGKSSRQPAYTRPFESRETDDRIRLCRLLAALLLTARAAQS